MVLAIAVALTLLPATYSYGGAAPFHFSYRGLYRTTPKPGESCGSSAARAGGWRTPIAVSPLRLPPYAGGLSGELPLYASGYIDGLSGKFDGFVLRGEGKTRVNTVPAYNVLYTATVEGREMYGRDVLLLPERDGRARRGGDRDAEPAERADHLAAGSGDRRRAGKAAEDVHVRLAGTARR